MLLSRAMQTGDRYQARGKKEHRPAGWRRSYPNRAAPRRRPYGNLAEAHCNRHAI